MDRKEHRLLRLGILGGFLVVVLILYLGVLYDTQVNDYNKYLAQSIRSIAREEKVEASRGIITDRSGRPMVSNRSTYSLTFDASLLQKGDDENEAILRLIRLCQAQGVAWVDNLPITAVQPFAYTVDQLSSIQKGRFMTYVKSLPDAREALGKYFLSHPEATGSAETAESILAQTELDQDAKAAALVDCLTADAFSAQLLEDAGVTVSKLLGMMRAKLEIPSYFTLEEARLVLGVQYELSLRKLDNYDAYILAEDIDTVFISLLSDGDYAGAKVSRSTVREYERNLPPTFWAPWAAFRPRTGMTSRARATTWTTGSAGTAWSWLSRSTSKALTAAGWYPPTPRARSPVNTTPKSRSPAIPWN